MDGVYKQFYRLFYLHTGGFIPTQPHKQSLLPGDFFQIRNGNICLLGNIYQANMVEEALIQIAYDLPLNQAEWNISDGSRSLYAGRDQANLLKEKPMMFSKQVLAFQERGSFLFRGSEPSAVRITNWSAIEESLIQEFTHNTYSFREVYLVYECATLTHWALAVASATDAELEIASEYAHPSPSDIFSQEKVKNIQSKGMAFFHTDNSNRPAFFKAKKLTVRKDKLSPITQNHRNQQLQHQKWTQEFFQNRFEIPEHAENIRNDTQVNPLDMLASQELTNKTVPALFRWEDADLDDIEKLFIHYGN